MEDIEVSKHLGKAFPDAFEANLLPKNQFLQNVRIFFGKFYNHQIKSKLRSRQLYAAG